VVAASGPNRVSGRRRRLGPSPTPEPRRVFAARPRRAGGYAPEVALLEGAEEDVLLEELVPVAELVGLGALDGPVAVGVAGALDVLGVLGVAGALGVLGAELPESCDPLCAASCCFTSATKSALWLSGIGVTATAVPQAL
jgi:hypothetical protein